MRRYILTSPKFKGQVSLSFNSSGVICQLDMMGADMDAHATAHFLRSLPFLESNLSTAFSKSVIIVEHEFVVTFEEFWTAYDKKINRKRALILWDKMSLPNKVKAFYGIRKYDEFLKKANRIKYDPENYLKNETWENEYQ